MKLAYRVRQLVFYCGANGQQPPALPDEARLRLTGQMTAQFSMLPSGDQYHLLSVFNYLNAAGAQDDTITVGLILDVGKACPTSRITVVDRALHVLCTRFLPGPYARFASLEAPSGRWLGLHRLANHAERGAAMAARSGYNDRICRLILHHEKRHHAFESDPELMLLREADDAADASNLRKRTCAIHRECATPRLHASLLP